MAVAKESEELLDMFRLLELEKFAPNNEKERSFGYLKKINQISDMFSKISMHIETHTRSIFTIENIDRTLSINIINFDENTRPRDIQHYDKYLVTTSKSLLTYQIEEIQSDWKTTKIIRQEFDKTKL